MDLNKTIDAPVVLFIYKRPNHTKKILDKINQVKPKKVYVIGDGWKSKDDKILVKETRELISELTFKTENSPQLANCILDAIRDNTLAEKALINGPNLVKKYADWNTEMLRIEKKYYDLIKIAK